MQDLKVQGSTAKAPWKTWWRPQASMPSSYWFPLLVTSTTPARRAIACCKLFCARSRRLPASEKPGRSPRTFGSSPSGRPAGLHHSSQRSGIARNIVPVLGATFVAARGPIGPCPLRHTLIFEAVDHIGRVAEVADGGDLVRGPAEQHEIFGLPVRLVRIEHQDRRATLDRSRDEVPVADQR